MALDVSVDEFERRMRVVRDPRNERIRKACADLVDATNGLGVRDVEIILHDAVVNDHHLIQTYFWQMLHRLAADYAHASHTIQNEGAVRFAAKVAELENVKTGELRITPVFCSGYESVSGGTDVCCYCGYNHGCAGRERMECDMCGGS